MAYRGIVNKYSRKFNLLLITLLEAFNANVRCVK